MQLLSSFTFNNLTTTQRDTLTPLIGDTIFNITDDELQSYDGVGWTSAKRLKIRDGIRTFIRDVVPINTNLSFTKMSIQTTFEAGAPLSKCHALFPPTDTVTLNIVKSVSPYTVDTTIGTLTWTTGNATPVISLTTTTVFEIDDLLKLVSPTDVFGMRDVSIDLVGWTLMPIY